MAVVETAGRSESAGAGQEKLNALLRRRGRRQQAERISEPVSGAGRREPEGFVSGRAQDGRRVNVALPRRALDVVRTGRCWCAAIRECARAALVGAEAPPARSRLVDRAPHERMSEAETPRHVGGAEKVEL